jgi:Tfp pilus assembly protein PilO
MEKMRQWTILTALGVVGVLAAGWFVLVSPQRAHVSDLKTKAASEQSATAQLQTQVAQLKQQQNGEPAQQRKLMKIASQIPDNPQLPALIRELSDAAHKAGVSLDSLAPAQPLLQAPAATTTPGAVAPPPLAQIPVTISVTGSYFNIESFMRSLEHLDRALLTKGLTVGPATGSSDAKAVPNALTGQVSAVVFESPIVAPVAAQTAPAPVPSASASAPTTTTPAQSGSGN